ncbi:MAG: WYL domain-containing protein [Desulfotalea sp.]
MAKYKPQHRRLLFIDEEISKKRYPNCSSMGVIWEVSYKTIQRDIDYLRDELDAPIEYSAKYRGFYYTEENFNLPAISIRESDLFSIYLAEELLEQYRDTPLYDRLNSIYKKIADSLPQKYLDDYHPSQRFTVFSSPSTQIKPKIWDCVFNAARKLLQLEIVYASPGSKVQDNRTIEPYHTIRYDGDWYVVAFCLNRMEMRTFSLSRIQHAKIKNTPFRIPDDFDFAKITASRFGIHWQQEREKISIKFCSQSAPYIIERSWHDSQEIEKLANGYIILHLQVNASVELKKWILSWGASAEVIEPQSLRGEIIDEIKVLASIYS